MGLAASHPGRFANLAYVELNTDKISERTPPA